MTRTTRLVFLSFLLCSLLSPSWALRLSSKSESESESEKADPRIVVEQKPGLANTTIVVHVVNDNDGRPPAPPPRPFAAPAARLGVPLSLTPGAFPGMGMGMGGGYADSSSSSSSVTVPSPDEMQLMPAAPLISPMASMSRLDLHPEPLSVTTPAADLLPAAAVTPHTGEVKNDPVGTFAVQTVPGVRIVGETEQQCKCRGDPACHCRLSATDQIEAALDRVKTKIVEDAQKVQQENRWMKSVKKIIKHYKKKISRVTKHVGDLKTDIKQLFAKKKHYEDLLLQHQLDEHKFLKVQREKDWKKQKDAAKKAEKFEKNCEQQRKPRHCHHVDE